jgi:hypothetical protein
MSATTTNKAPPLTRHPDQRPKTTASSPPRAPQLCAGMGRVAPAAQSAVPLAKEVAFNGNKIGPTRPTPHAAWGEAGSSYARGPATPARSRSVTFPAADPSGCIEALHNLLHSSVYRSGRSAAASSPRDSALAVSIDRNTYMREWQHACVRPRAARRGKPCSAGRRHHFEGLAGAVLARHRRDAHGARPGAT